jgi:hypothetical protein
MNGNEKSRANGKLTVRANMNVGAITFDFTRPGMSARTLAATPPIVFHVGRVADSQHVAAEYHGWIQRIRDTAAGKALDVGYAAVRRLVDHYESGSADWDMRPTRGPGAIDMLVAALVALKGKPENVIRAYVEAKSAGAQRKMLALPDVAAKVAELFGTDEEIDLDSDLDQFERETAPGAGDETEELDKLADAAGLEK